MARICRQQENDSSLDVWGHLDALTDESRWLHATKALSIDERETRCIQKATALQSLNIDDELRDRISSELVLTLDLVQKFAANRKGRQFVSAGFWFQGHDYLGDLWVVGEERIPWLWLVAPGAASAEWIDP